VNENRGRSEEGADKQTKTGKIPVGEASELQRCYRNFNNALYYHRIWSGKRDT
jgi:hypothetical protein